MRWFYCLSALVVVLSAACADRQGDPKSDDRGEPIAGGFTPDRIGSNRIASNRIASNRIGANRIASNRLTEAALVNGAMQVNAATSSELLSTDDGRQVFSLIVECALPENASVHATIDSNDFEFDGAIGLAPQWLVAPLDPIAQRWVSACMFSQVSGVEVAVPISLRGPRPQLAADRDERAAFTGEEGAFFGNAFGPLDRPIQWFACRGRDAVAGAIGDRVCAQPDPSSPGLTQCGFTYTGDCGNFAQDTACDAFVPGSFYVGCHTEPRGSRDASDRTFPEVVTTFVEP